MKRDKSMSLRRAVKRGNALVVDDLTNGGLRVIPVTNKNKASQRYKHSNQAIKPSVIAYTSKQLDEMTAQSFEHRFKDGQVIKFLSSVFLFGPLAPLVKPRELVIG
jgi:hypothetical protein